MKTCFRLLEIDLIEKNVKKRFTTHFVVPYLISLVGKLVSSVCVAPNGELTELTCDLTTFLNDNVLVKLSVAFVTFFQGSLSLKPKLVLSNELFAKLCSWLEPVSYLISS